MSGKSGECGAGCAAARKKGQGPDIFPAGLTQTLPRPPSPDAVQVQGRGVVQCMVVGQGQRHTCERLATAGAGAHQGCGWPALPPGAARSRQTHTCIARRAMPLEPATRQTWSVARYLQLAGWRRDQVGMVSITQCWCAVWGRAGLSGGQGPDSLYGSLPSDLAPRAWGRSRGRGGAEVRGCGAEGEQRVRTHGVGKVLVALA